MCRYQKREQNQQCLSLGNFIPSFESPPAWPDDYRPTVALVTSECLTEIMRLLQNGKPDCEKTVWLDLGRSFSVHDVVAFVVDHGRGEVWRCCLVGQGCRNVFLNEPGFRRLTYP